MPAGQDVVARIREVIRQHARLAVDVNTLKDEADLYAAGMTSHATVNLMLGLEESFEIEFPDRMLGRRSFGSIGAIHDAVRELLEERG